jgi:hypothetical protein
MTMIAWAILGLLLVGTVSGLGGAVSEMELANGPIRVRFSLPGEFYRGTRFDWSGVISGLEFAGHNYYPQWFQRTDPKVHDFIFDGPDIVAGPCTAITGPAEEFVSSLGFEQAKVGGTFIKIGVGVLRKPDEQRYDMLRLYPIVDGGRWSFSRKSDSIEFKHEVADPAAGYGYEYRKTVSLIAGQPQMVLDHVLRNKGKQAIHASVYNHNFLYLDRQGPSADFVLRFPFQVRTSPEQSGGLVEIRDNTVSFSKTLRGEDRVSLALQGFSADPGDYDIRVENRKLGAGVRITSDRPLSRLALWAIRAPFSIEPFIDVNVEPGAEFTWRIQYEYYTLARGK